MGDSSQTLTLLRCFRVCREGASILDIPTPEASKEPALRGVGHPNAGLSADLGKSFGPAPESYSMTGSEPLKMRKRGAGAKSRVRTLF